MTEWMKTGLALPDLIVLAVILVGIAAAIKYEFQHRSMGCGGNCASCNNRCREKTKQKRNRKEK